MQDDQEIAFFQQITEEVKEEQLMKTLQKHSNTIVGVVAAAVLGILIYSTWQERHKRKMEDITNALLVMVQNPTSKDELMLDKLLEDAPADIRPILMLMKSGKQLVVGKYVEEDLKPLLDLSTRNGVDIIWRDLALLMYLSYTNKSSEDLIQMLKPLTEKNRPFRFSAMEMIAMANLNVGNQKEALDSLNEILNAEDAPNSMKERIKIVAQYVEQLIAESK